MKEKNEKYAVLIENKRLLHEKVKYRSQFNEKLNSNINIPTKIQKSEERTGISRTDMLKNNGNKVEHPNINNGNTLKESCRQWEVALTEYETNTDEGYDIVQIPQIMRKKQTLMKKAID